MIDVWNSQVKPGDTVWHIGDFCFGKSDQMFEILQQLNGQKIFIKGNHDKRENLEYFTEDGWIQAWYEYKEIKLGETSTCLFHFPISSWHKQAHGSFHLHGHSHGGHTESKGKMLDVGLDSAYNIFGEHKFFSEDEIHAIMQTKQLFIADQHRN